MKTWHSEALLLASRLLAYPDADYLASLPELWERCTKLSQFPEGSLFAKAVRDFIEAMQENDLADNGRRYVEIFDFTAKASLYMSWHRYGNDRSQGQAMAALNGLYRAAGLEPAQLEMPDYLPRMLEFMAVAPAWAIATLLDGFGPEIQGVLDCLYELQAPHAPFLNAALEPLRKDFLGLFEPRKGPDPTRRPMSNPDPEPSGPLLSSKK